METVTLKAEVRNATKKGPSRRLRARGFVPAILYGSRQEPVMIAVGSEELLEIMKKERKEGVFVRLAIQGDGGAMERLSVLKDVQVNTVKKRLDHADFYEIRMDRELTLEVPIILKGRAKGQELGGDVQHMRRELRVAGLPGKLPEAIELDISDLSVGDSLRVKELSVPEGVRLVDHGDVVIVHIAVTRASAQVLEQGPAEEAAEAAPAEGATAGEA